MNSPHWTQSLHSLTLLSQELADLSKGGLDHQPVDTLLRVADQIRAIAQVGEPLHTEIQTSWPASFQDETQQAALNRSQALLSQIINQCKGAGQPPYPLKKLGSDLKQWKTQFEKLLRQVEDLETTQALHLECQQLYQTTQEMQHQAIALDLENPLKLDLLRRLIDLEKTLGAIDHDLQQGKRDGKDDQEKLAQVKRVIDDVQLTYGLATGSSA